VLNRLSARWDALRRLISLHFYAFHMLLTSQKEILGAGEHVPRRNTRVSMPINIIHALRRERKTKRFASDSSECGRATLRCAAARTDNVRETGASRLICTFETSSPSCFFPFSVISFPFDAIIRPTFTCESTLWVNPTFQRTVRTTRTSTYSKNIVFRAYSEKSRNKNHFNLTLPCSIKY